MKVCKQCTKDFEINSSDIDFYKKLEVPEPNYCPDCRRQKLIAFWPFGIMQKRKCDFSGETIISIFGESCRFPVYKQEYWQSDKWEAPQSEIDWNRPFFNQLFELQTKTPHFHRIGKSNENSDYADDVWFCKNIYMSRSLAYAEDCMHVYRFITGKDTLDITFSFELEGCYECIYCVKGYNLRYSSYCTGCSDSWFLYDCRNVTNSIFCWNLRNKEYCIANKQYTKEEYEEKLKAFKFDSRNFLRKAWKKMEEYIKNEAYHRPDNNLNIENCDGNYITDSNNCQDCFFVGESEDCYHLTRAHESKSCIDSVGIFKGELAYEVSQCTSLNNVKFALYSTDCFDCEYIDQCENCNNCFGCVGLKRKEYCIFNKPYTKEEYFETVKRLKKHMIKTGEYGEFFPYKFAYVGFNLSLGAFYYKHDKEYLESIGSFYEEEPGISSQGINGGDLPDLSSGITEEYVGQIINCENTGKPYNFIKREIDYYKDRNLPLPSLYPEERNRHRFAKMAPFYPRNIKCFECQKDIVVYYPENWGYKKILCKECYLGKVY